MNASEKTLKADFARFYEKKGGHFATSDLDAFANEHGVNPKKIYAISEEFEAKRERKVKKKVESKSGDLTIFQRKLILPRQFLSGFDEAGRFYRGTYIANQSGAPEPVIVLADGGVIREPLFGESGLQFKDYPAVEDAAGVFGWAGQATGKFIENIRKGKKPKKFREIYPTLRHYFTRRGHFLDANTPEFLAIWCAGTFLGSAITLPRVIFVAPPGSGKSQIIRAIRGATAFPVLMTDATKASLFRMAAGQTVLVDNFDKLPEEQKGDVVHFAETTFEGDGATYRVEDMGKKRVPTRFSAKVPMVIGGLAEDAYSEALMSRSVVIRLEKRPEGVKIFQVPESGSEAEAESIRTDLYAWGTVNAGRIREALRTYDCGKQDRAGKFYATMLLLADEIGLDCRKSVEAWLDLHVQTEEIEEYSEAGQVLSALWNLLENNPGRSVQVLEVAEAWADLLGIYEKDDQGRANQNYRRELNKLAQKAAKHLKAIPGAKHSKPKNKSTFVFGNAALLRYLRRFGIVECEQSKLVDTTPNPPNPPNTTNTPNPPNQTPSEKDEKGLGGIGTLGGLGLERGKEGIGDTGSSVCNRERSRTTAARKRRRNTQLQKRRVI